MADQRPEIPRLATVLVRMLGMPSALSEEDQVADLTVEFGMALDSFGVTEDVLGWLADEWVSQLRDLLAELPPELERTRLARAAAMEVAKQRRAEQAQAQQVTDNALRGWFDTATLSPDWLGINQPQPEDEP